MKFDDLDIAYYRFGVVYRVTSENKPVAKFDLAKDYREEDGLANTVDVPEDAYLYRVQGNGDDAVVYARDGSLKLVLLRSGQIVREDKQLAEYARKAFLSHSWVEKNPRLAQDMLNVVLGAPGFVGKTSVSMNVGEGLLGLLAEHFRAKGTVVPLSGIKDDPRVAEKGFWLSAKSVGHERRAYYFDLLTDSVYLLTGLFPDLAPYWSEERKLALSIDLPEGSRTLKVLQYSLDFLKDP